MYFRILHTEGNRTSLVTQIIDLKLAKKKLDEDFKKKNEQTQKYVDKVIKLQIKCTDIERDLKQQNNITETLKAENQKLQDEKNGLKHEITGNESVQLVNEAKVAELYLRRLETNNEEMKNRISRYYKEMKEMQMKLSDCYKRAKHDAAAIMPNRSSGVHDMITTDAVSEKKKVPGIAEIYDKQRAHHGPTNPIEKMAKLFTRHQNGAASIVPKQKSSQQIRKSRICKGLTEQYPRQFRKPPR